MKYIAIIGIAVVGFLGVNFPSLFQGYSNYEGVKEFKGENFSGALDRFLQTQTLYNMAGAYYKLEDYQNALDIYSELEEKNAKTYHNIGNTQYFLARQEKNNITKRIDKLKDAIVSYESSQALRYTDETQNNIEIVQKEIDALEKALEQEETASEEEQQESSDETGGESGESNESSESGNSSEEGTGETEEGGEEQGGEADENGEASANNDESSNGLSQEEQEAIDSYSEKLEEAQGSYGQYYNKVYSDSQSDLDRIFANDPFFDNSLLDGEAKKDW